LDSPGELERLFEKKPVRSPITYWEEGKHWKAYKHMNDSARRWCKHPRGRDLYLQKGKCEKGDEVPTKGGWSQTSCTHGGKNTANFPRKINGESKRAWGNWKRDGGEKKTGAKGKVQSKMQHRSGPLDLAKGSTGPGSGEKGAEGRRRRKLGDPIQGSR